MMFEKHIHQAPEIRGDHWLNSTPLSTQMLRGNVVLLFFWDQTCIRSLRMMEYIKEINSRYREFGLMVIGVHSPAFDFAGRVELLERTLYDKGISFPVVMDNRRNIFEDFRNSETPSVIIIDQEGNIRAHYYGRGKQLIIERDVQVCLKDNGIMEALPLPMTALHPEEIPGVVCSRETPRILFGYLRGNLGNNDGYNPESIFSYEDPDCYLPGRFYLNGLWRSDRHSMTLEKITDKEGYVTVKYEGREVFALIGQRESEPVKLEIRQDGRFLDDANKGDDIEIDEDNSSYITVSSPGLFHLVRNKESAEYGLRITCRGAGVQMYSITFIPGVIPELLGKN